MRSVVARGRIAALALAVFVPTCERTEKSPDDGVAKPEGDADAQSESADEALPAKVEHFHKKGEWDSTVDGQGEGPYRFSADWHLVHLAHWERILGPLAGQPGLRYLEIGVYEGRSLVWMLENVLTHPSSAAVAVDIFAGDYEEVFDHNLAASGAADRVTKKKGPSRRVLRELPIDAFDIVYIDGSHTADDVLADAVSSWPLLETGGLMIFDDYGWPGRPGSPLPMELLPRLAIDAFVVTHRYELEILHRDYQVFVRKRANPCQPKDYCSPVGQYQYYWRDYELRTGEGEVVPLTREELEIVEAIARSPRSNQPDQPEIVLSPQLEASPAAHALRQRLDLKL